MLVVVLFLMAFLGMQVAGWIMYGAVMAASVRRYEREPHRDQNGELI